MHALSPLDVRDLCRLVDLRTGARKQRRRRGSLPLICEPKQLGDSRWREPVYLIADAVVVVAIDRLVQGQGSAPISAAFGDIQLSILNALPAVEDGVNVKLVLCHDHKQFIVATAETMGEAMTICLKHFEQRGVSNPAELFDALDVAQKMLKVFPQASAFRHLLPK